MWRATNTDGTLTYSFVETVQAMHPYYIVRFLGGAFFLVGTLVMAVNLWKTIAGAKPAVGTIPAPAAHSRLFQLSSAFALGNNTVKILLQH